MKFAWQHEYGIVSLGEKQLDWVIEYINKQKEHHRAGTLIAALEDNGSVEDPKEPETKS